MTYPDPIHVYRLTDAPEGAGGDAASPADVPDEDSGWGTPPDAGTPSGAETLYDGPADVQDGQRTLRRLADVGESETANAVVYLPPAGARAFAQVQTGDLVTTPLGAGEVVGLMQTDAALAVAVTRSTPAVPVILA